MPRAPRQQTLPEPPNAERASGPRLTTPHPSSSALAEIHTTGSSPRTAGLREGDRSPLLRRTAHYTFHRDAADPIGGLDGRGLAAGSTISLRAFGVVVPVQVVTRSPFTTDVRLVGQRPLHIDSTATIPGDLTADGVEQLLGEMSVRLAAEISRYELNAIREVFASGSRATTPDA